MKTESNLVQFCLLVAMPFALPALLQAQPALTTNDGAITILGHMHLPVAGPGVTPVASGARLPCVSQRLDGEVTSQGLSLTSTVANSPGDHFRVTAIAVSRRPERPPAVCQLERTGEISFAGQTVRFARPGLTEEYSASINGLRQDFIVEQSPPGPGQGEMVVDLAVSGARVEPAAGGARLVLNNSGRKIAYRGLRVTDATGKELPARFEVGPAADANLAIVVNDTRAVYPVRIDPTFSDANWVNLGGLPGANGQGNATVVDGSGNLYVGGNFTVIGNTAANCVAKWNGTNWTALGSGLNGGVIALAVSGNTLYAGGTFTNVGGGQTSYIAQWNGTNWSAVGSGMSNAVYALAVSGGTLYAGGLFTGASGVSANYIAQWNGTGWSALSTGMDNRVFALAVIGSTLYAGGYFDEAGGNSAAAAIAQWNGNTWLAVGSGVGPAGDYPGVLALAVSGSTLYAAGEFNFTAEGGATANNVAEWNGANWLALGSGLNGSYATTVNALAVSGGALYAGGEFYTEVGDTYAYCYNVEEWSGGAWSPLGVGVGSESDYVNALAVSSGTLYVGGVFETAGSGPAMGVAQWNGTNWSTWGGGMNGAVNALATSGNSLYAGGFFTAAGANLADCVAEWNGSSWSVMGSAISAEDNYPYVNSLVVSGGTLFVGGNFDAFDGVTANDIVQYNGATWSALAAGLNGDVVALAASGGILYAASAGDDSVSQWNGTNWSTTGSLMDGIYGGVAYALAVSSNTLYAGGVFTEAGGVPANNIAEWNGANWLSLGGGISNTVYALAVSGDTLYAGGSFTNAGGVAVNDIAQWNGTNWSALGAGINGTVSALAVIDGILYAGGDFTSAGGSPANYIAQWNGTNWSAVGSGMNSSVSALVASGGALYAGGNFTEAGGTAFGYAVMDELSGSLATLAIITDNSAFGFTNETFGFDVSGPSGSNIVIQASADLRVWIPVQTNALGSNGLLYFTDQNSKNYSSRFYRAQSP